MRGVKGGGMMKIVTGLPWSKIGAGLSIIQPSKRRRWNIFWLRKISKYCYIFNICLRFIRLGNKLNTSLKWWFG